MIGNLYYGILGIDINQPLGDFISNQLGIDVQQDIIDERAIRAGTTKSRISRQDRFDQDVTLADAAGDLGLTPSDLLSNIDLLDPVLSVLKKRTLDRDDFTQLYVASRCTLSTLLNNQPVAVRRGAGRHR